LNTTDRGKRPATVIKGFQKNPKVKSVAGVAVSEKTRRALERLGLTGYEVRAYLALVESGGLTAADISKLSGVPYSKIYETLRSLEAKGWLETEAKQSRPTKVYARPPAIALETMRLRRESEWRDNEKVILDELTPVYEGRGAKERPEIWIVRGEFNILTRVREAIDSCGSQLMLAVPSHLTQFLEMVQGKLMELRSRGVKLEVMISEDADKDLLRRIASTSSLRIRSQMFGGGLIADSREVILLIGPGGEGSTLAISSNHPGLAKLASDYFEYLWGDSKSFETKSQ